MWAYRALPHEATGETPSFLLMGYDVKMSFDSQEVAVEYSNNKERLKLIKEIREFLRNRWEAGRLMEEIRANEGRKDVVFKKWSYPFRVTKVEDRGRKALVTSLYDSSVQREVHISNVKFVNPPVTLQQEVQWEQEKLYEAADLRSRRQKAQLALGWAILRSEQDFVTRFKAQVQLGEITCVRNQLYTCDWGRLMCA